MKGNVLIKVIFSVALMVMGMMAGATPVGQRDTMARKTDGREVVLLKKGDMMPNYVFKDVNGKRVSLKSFRGKYVYIDIWATWCGSCVEQTPYFEELEDKLHNKKIVFVSISVDKHREAWVRKVKAEKSRVPRGGGYSLAGGFRSSGYTSFYFTGQEGANRGWRFRYARLGADGDGFARVGRNLKIL